MLNIKIHVLIQLLHVIVKFEAFVIGYIVNLIFFIKVFITNNIETYLQYHMDFDIRSALTLHFFSFLYISRIRKNEVSVFLLWYSGGESKY